MAYEISVPDARRYRTIFDQLQPTYGKLSGEKIREVFLKFQLPVETLGKIWDLSDIDNDGSLDQSEFIIAFPAGETLTTQSTHTTPTVWALSSHQPYLQSYNFPEWAISADEHAKNLRVFAALDMDADGLVSGPEVRDILMRSGLPQDILAHIWDLVDIQNTGLLNSEQFTVAMHLATEQLSAGLSNRTLPNVLPPALLPPSLRPIPPDPSIYEESNKLIVEIEALSRYAIIIVSLSFEKSAVESDYISMAKDSQRRASEATAKQRTIDTLNHTIRNLANQRVEAERRLGDYSREKDTLESVLNEIKSHVMNERQKVEEMRIKINCQQASTKSQKEEIACLRNELNELIREEAMLQDKIIENQRRLEQIEKENRLAQSRVDQANNKLETLESTRSQLLEVLEQYNGLLNGDGNIKEPDEARVKSLLSDESAKDSLRSFDTGLDGINWPNNNNNAPSFTTGISTFSAFDTARSQTGAHSVPLPLMSMNLVSGGDWKTNERGLLNSSLGFPFPYDPFDSNDPFKSKANEFHKESVEDPFALSSTNDPFKDSDPFGVDPFGLSYLMAKDKKSPNTIASAFDPFKPDSVCPTVLPENSLIGADFGAVR
ncbi:eps-15-related [Schistosoma mansoni]|uniref:eps-15-related n=1 Tax=Schistosoma mansoni TaxID=6183 RepID=UPI0001A623DF|nr:eps-15-related [Schistosoma mansoni]|eukprot:XP_018653851.1 eps-15-related [Schistosoma mansoni]